MAMADAGVTMPPPGDSPAEPPPAVACPNTSEDSVEACSDGIDNDCDGSSDCADSDCSGVGGCPVCGMVEQPLSSPLALPDGVGGTMCSSDADCSGDQGCFELRETRMECRAPYRSSLDFVGFGDSATFDDINNIRSVCVVMEHSWLRDLQIELRSPSGQVVELQRFLGQTGSEIYLGQANDCDSSASPVPGDGAMYCWKPDSTNPPMLEYANDGGSLNDMPSCIGGPSDGMPPGDYAAAGDWMNLLGSPLNGSWELSVTDLWPLDNGYIFEWSITFDADLVEDCSVPLI